MSRRRLLPLLLILAAHPAPAEKATGLILDATLLDLQRCRFPKFYDPDGVMIYPTRQLCQNADYRQGFSGYAPSLKQARAETDRCGERPLVLRPVGVNRQDPTGGSVDLTAEQAAQLLALNGEFGLLDSDRVVIVLGLAVVETVPSAGAAVEPGTPLRALFSKPLRPGSWDQPGRVRLQDDDEQAIPMEVSAGAGARALELKPATPLTPGKTYRLTLSGAITARSMAPLGDDFVLIFSVAAPPSPSDPGPPAEQGDGATD